MKSPRIFEVLCVNVGFQRGLQFAVSQRLVLVEERHDQHRCHELDDQQKHHHRTPGIEPRQRSHGLEKPQNRGENTASDQHRQQDAFELVEDKRARRGFVEAVFLLDDERPVNRERQVKQFVQQRADAEEDQSGENHAETKPASKPIHHAKAAEQDERQRQNQVNRAAPVAEAQVGPDVLLRAPVFLRVHEIAKFLRQIGRQAAPREHAHHQVEQIVADQKNENQNKVEFHWEK